MQTLVVYYSRTGHTKKVGDEIAKALSCDVEELVDTVNRSGPIGWINSGRQASQKSLTKLEPLKKDLSKYDMVIIGTPVWAATMSTPVRTFIAENKDKLKGVAFFTTLGSTGADSTFKAMEELCGKAPAASLVVTTADFKKGSYEESLKKFTSGIQH